jgi:hypothetical protein
MWSPVRAELLHFRSIERLVHVAHQLFESFSLLGQAAPSLGHVHQARAVVGICRFFRHLHACFGKQSELLETHRNVPSTYALINARGCVGLQANGVVTEKILKRNKRMFRKLHITSADPVITASGTKIPKLLE